MGTLSADTMIGQCYVCSENIETQHDLLVHVRLHQSQLLSLIDLIDVSDSQSTIGNVGASRRQSGVITTQMSRDRSLECQVCKGKKFRRTNDLTRHYATHCRWTDLSLDGHCPSCSAQLRNPSNFLTHQCPGPHDKQRKEKCSSIRSAIDAFYKVPKTNYSQLSQSGELTWGQGFGLEPSNFVSSGSREDNNPGIPVGGGHHSALYLLPGDATGFGQNKTIWDHFMGGS